MAAKKILTTGISGAFVLAVIAGFVQNSPAGINPDDIFYAVSVNGSAYSKENRVFIKYGDEISVAPVFVIDGKMFSSVKTFTVDGNAVTAKRPPKFEFAWFQINPEYIENGYDNFENAPKNQFSSYLEKIKYKYFPMNKKTNRLRLSDIAADGFGAYYIMVMQDDTAPADFESSGAFFTETGALQIVYRSGDDYLGYLSELMRSPFIMYPKKTGLGHQTDLLLGSDCAEFAIYGMRRLGADIPYCGPRKIYDYLIELNDNDFIMPGDILHYGSQVAVYYQSMGTPGKISVNDILLQSYGAKPYFTTVSENSKVFGKYKAYRWRDK